MPGGIKGFGIASKTLYVYNPSTNTWATKAAMPAAGGCGASGVIAGKLYAFSGCDANVERDETVRPVRSLDQHLDDAGGPGIAPFLSGGRPSSTASSTWSAAPPTATRPLDLTQALEVYDPGTGSWKTRAPAPTARYGAAAVGLNGQLYVFGGFDAFEDAFTTVEVYSPSSNSWRTLSSMPTARGYLAAGVINGQAYAVGGECCGTGTYTGVNEAYTP